MASLQPPRLKIASRVPRARFPCRRGTWARAREYGRSLFAWMNVHGNVALPLRRKKPGKPREKELVDHALQVGDLASPIPAPCQLPGAMQQVDLTELSFGQLGGLRLLRSTV
ncbi:hypothetical protein ABZ379_46505 [Streptomyces canus]|uniref:hypothetical protein n=1 Tax=Streptomyces canus TaxID=58343 RepID=UPI0033C83A51